MIRLHTDGTRKLPNLLKRWLKLGQKLRRLFSIEIVLDDRGHRTVYSCETAVEAFRPLSLWTKEPATIAWIDAEMKAGYRFLDIGANIGIYTLAAAKRAGASGRVYAIEPHKANALSLMRNIAANQMGSIVQVFVIGLGSKIGFDQFNYISTVSASTGSQLGQPRQFGDGALFEPVISERLPTFTVDELIRMGAIVPPHLVKIDVDGIEPAILEGMSELLHSRDRPLSVLVEINPGQFGAIDELMRDAGYTFCERGDTQFGLKKAARGVPIEEIAYNALFRAQANRA